MKPMAGIASFLRVILFSGIIATLFMLGGCYYPGYYDDSYYYPYDHSISFYPPAIDFYYSDRQTYFSYFGYPYFYPYYPYFYPGFVYDPRYR